MRGELSTTYEIDCGPPICTEIPVVEGMMLTGKSKYASKRIDFLYSKGDIDSLKKMIKRGTAITTDIRKFIDKLC